MHISYEIVLRIFLMNNLDSVFDFDEVITIQRRIFMGLKDRVIKHREKMLAEREIGEREEREAVEKEGNGYFVKKFYSSMSSDNDAAGGSLLLFLLKPVLKAGIDIYFDQDSSKSIYEKVSDYSNKYNLEIISISSPAITNDNNESVEVVFKKRQNPST